MQQVFRRVEKKYLISGEQLKGLVPVISGHMTDDEYTDYMVCNIYFDTDSYQLIRTSLGKPKYKEKLRLRSYGVPGSDSRVFIELKKKYDGIVYKRRVGLTLAEAQKYLGMDGTSSLDGLLRTHSSCDGQILKEIGYVMQFYHLKPKVFIAYDRKAFKGKEDSGLRLTLDRRIRARDTDLSLSQGDYGKAVIRPDQVLMEVKIPDSMPLWMARAFADLGIVPVSFSKYGTYYTQNHIIGEKCLTVSFRQGE